jgi:2-polyprenyl-6-hydroxyphenyl methylase/3-demethylubiquinone-9 3-methyltransferase
MNRTSVDHLKYDERSHFEFGKNWESYSGNISEEDIEVAQNELSKLLETDSLSGKSFLDIGCGSGIHSLVALKLGADFVRAIDIDQNSVRTAQMVISNSWNKGNYEIEKNNIFDIVPEIYGKFDIVYSWGVLHHTGDMWSAIHSAAALTKDGGLFAFAIYKKTKLCDFWRWEKRIFTKSGSVIRGIFIAIYVTLRVLWDVVRLRNPFKKMRSYRQKRGMRWYTDVVDWLGGYPYESALPEEIVGFLEGLGFRLKRSFRTKSRSGVFGTGNAEYVFEKRIADDSPA